MPTVDTCGIETYFEHSGSGPPIVFVHGMFMRSEQWEPQLASLSDEYTTIAYDVRGHGRTGGSDREAYSIELFADDLAALLDALSVDRPVLCGLSMGGCIVQAFAARHPDRVAGLVLADTFPAGSLPLGARAFFVNLRLFAVLDRFVRYPTLNRLQMWVGNRLAPGTAGDTRRIQALHELPPLIPHDEFVKIVDAMVGFQNSRLDCSAVTAPTLVTYGEHAPAQLAGLHDRIAAAFPNATVTTAELPWAGHASNVDNPTGFSDLLRRFIEERVDGPVQ